MAESKHSPTILWNEVGLTFETRLSRGTRTTLTENCWKNNEEVSLHCVSVCWKPCITTGSGIWGAGLEPVQWLHSLLHTKTTWRLRLCLRLGLGFSAQGLLHTHYCLDLTTHCTDVCVLFMHQQLHCPHENSSLPPTIQRSGFLPFLLKHIISYSRHKVTQIIIGHFETFLSRGQSPSVLRWWWNYISVIILGYRLVISLKNTVRRR